MVAADALRETVEACVFVTRYPDDPTSVHLEDPGVGSDSFFSYDATTLMVNGGNASMQAELQVRCTCLEACGCRWYLARVNGVPVMTSADVEAVFQNEVPQMTARPKKKIAGQTRNYRQLSAVLDSGTVVYVMGSFFHSVTLGGAWLNVRVTGVTVDPINLHVDMMKIREGPEKRQMDAVCDCSRPNGGCCCAWRLAAVDGRSVCTGNHVSALGEECLKYGKEAKLAFVKEHRAAFGNFGFA
ncbi:hypothetical protein TeGR_g10336 [Tetraparma gracilis]|uniref:Uncharacterized protein n=1 Tax=Tetraparma gracilis TaxID=2962635 RepID=A0ABQ6MI78_9STRA|nr:hypothetical protein TeGR_g10336 [Tetraparma gracilis]